MRHTVAIRSESRAMNVRKEHEAKRFENSHVCVAFEYEQPTNAMDMARIELSGRYPSDGWSLNTICEAIVYVMKGEGRFCTPDKVVEIAAGDQIHIPPNEKYNFEGAMELLFASTPKWSPEQACHESETLHIAL